MEKMQSSGEAAGHIKKKRKKLANNALQILCHIFEGKHLQTKVRVFKACIESVYSEIWTTNKTTNELNSFHRTPLRRAINIRQPKEISMSCH